MTTMEGRSRSMGPLSMVAACAVLVAGGTYWAASATLPDTSAPQVRVVDVSGELHRTGNTAWAASGGHAVQAPLGSWAQMFRLSPDDRIWRSGCDGPANAPETYYLEDPYAPVSMTRGLGTHQELRTPKTPGPVVFFVDGDLVVDSHRIRAFTVGGAPSIEFVAHGNIHIGDDVRAAPGTLLTFTALKREGEPESGNIYAQDLAFGTLERIEADLHAEGKVTFNRHRTGPGLLLHLGELAEGVRGR